MSCIVVAAVRQRLPLLVESAPLAAEPRPFRGRLPERLPVRLSQDRDGVACSTYGTTRARREVLSLRIRRTRLRWTSRSSSGTNRERYECVSCRIRCTRSTGCCRDSCSGSSLRTDRSPPATVRCRSRSTPHAPSGHSRYVRVHSKHRTIPGHRRGVSVRTLSKQPDNCADSRHRTTRWHHKGASCRIQGTQSGGYAPPHYTIATYRACA